MSNFEVGSTYTGRVKKVVDFGAFVELEKGKDGLIHISKLADHRVEKASDIVSQDQMVEVEILALKGFKIELKLKSVLGT